MCSVSNAPDGLARRQQLEERRAGELGRHDEVGGRPDRLVAGVAVHPLRRRVPLGDDPIGGEADDRVRRAADERLGTVGVGFEHQTFIGIARVRQERAPRGRHRPRRLPASSRRDPDLRAGRDRVHEPADVGVVGAQAAAARRAADRGLGGRAVDREAVSIRGQPALMARDRQGAVAVGARPEVDGVGDGVAAGRGRGRRPCRPRRGCDARPGRRGGSSRSRAERSASIW